MVSLAAKLFWPLGQTKKSTTISTSCTVKLKNGRVLRDLNILELLKFLQIKGFHTFSGHLMEIDKVLGPSASMPRAHPSLR